MQVRAKSTPPTSISPTAVPGSRPRDLPSKTVPCEHGVARELLLIGLVVAIGVLAAVVILLPAMVTG
ncbi:hypothetical protein [Rhodococcus sovatensis]|uniref:Uncharacterized protein n=1 Tax=Rhodococcus sovatensis TaxID=1805840 RepID=A0ABZ2PH00_9NOCA